MQKSGNVGRIVHALDHLRQGRRGRDHRIGAVLLQLLAQQPVLCHGELVSLGQLDFVVIAVEEPPAHGSCSSVSREAWTGKPVHGLLIAACNSSKDLSKRLLPRHIVCEHGENKLRSGLPSVSNLPAHKKTVHEHSGAADAANPPSTKKTVYETSAGGVVLRHIRGEWQVAIIEPNIINADTITRRAKARPEGTVFALPKGGVDEGETPEQSADREVFEETGVRGLRLFRLTTIRYLYVRSWGGREHVSKAVSFYLFLYASGTPGQIRPDMRDEVRKAFWFPLDKAHRKLTYRGEREVLKMAQKIVREHPERLTPPLRLPPSTGPEARVPRRSSAAHRSAGTGSRATRDSRHQAGRNPAKQHGPSQQRGAPAARGRSAQATRPRTRPGDGRPTAPPAAITRNHEPGTCAADRICLPRPQKYISNICNSLATIALD